MKRYEAFHLKVGKLSLDVDTYVPGGFTVTDLGTASASLRLTGAFNTVIGGNGNETVFGGAGATTIVLGNGNDVIRLSGGLNTIVLGNGCDTIYAGDEAGSVRFSANNVSVNFHGFSVSMTGLSRAAFGSGNIGVFNGGTGNIGAFNGLFDSGTNNGSFNTGSFNGNLDGNGNADASSGDGNGNGNTGSLNGNLDGNFNVGADSGNGNGNANIGSLNGNDNGNGTGTGQGLSACRSVGATYHGTMNTIVVGNGNDTIYAGNGFNTVVGGNGNDIVFARGGHNTVSLGTGINFIALEGQSNTIVLNGHGLDRIADWSACSGDVLDFSKALADTAWDGRYCDLSSFLHVKQVGCDSWISVGRGSGRNVAELFDTRTSLNALLEHGGVKLT